MVRRLRNEEKALIAKMFRDLPAATVLSHSIEEAVVQDMRDEGMGSLRFVRLAQDKAHFGRQSSFWTADMCGDIRGRRWIARLGYD
jgi:hypothetical protein